MVLTLILIVFTYLWAGELFTHFLYPDPGEVGYSGLFIRRDGFPDNPSDLPASPRGDTYDSCLLFT